MVRRIGVTGVVMLALVWTAPVVLAQSGQQRQAGSPKEEQQFVTKAIQGNLAEAQLGKLGQEKSANEELRAFAQRLVADHTAANEKAIALARAAGMNPPDAPSAQQKRDYDRLAELSGSKFDREYIEHMVRDHRKDIEEYRKTADASGPVGDYARSTLPTLRQHLALAQSIAKDQKAAGMPGARK